MMTSEYKEAFVWIWLPEETEPVIAGKLESESDKLLFNYGKSYLERVNDARPAISIYDEELPLKAGILPLLEGFNIPGCIRDSAPDAWGRRVIINKKLGFKGANTDTTQLDELTYLLESGSDRIGALDFQLSPFEYIPRISETVSLTELLESTERFDRKKTAQGWQRKSMISALTLFGLDDMMARYASYEILAEIIRHKFASPTETLKELFSRLIFNILCGNTDDHARNHAAFWDGKQLSLTPAYDVCPQGRTGNEASQAMLISGKNRWSNIVTCLESAHHFLLTKDAAMTIFRQQKETIEQNWDTVCDEAGLTEVDKKLLWKRQFLNPFSFEGLD